MLVLFSLAFIVLEVLKYELLGDALTSIILVMLTVLYVRSTFKKQPFFFYFLITFTISEIILFITNFYPLVYNDIEFDYYINNFLYALSYIFLIILCVKSMVFKDIISKFPVTLFILFALGVFSVTLITETAQPRLDTVEYAAKFLYNIVVMTLLSVSLLYYMYKEDNKSMLFFMGSMLIFFSEMIQLAYFYIAEIDYLAAIYSIFLVLAFGLYYGQSQIEHLESKSIPNQKLKA
ncbi:MAG: hypothetical protein HKP48_04740 [Winogradskyella sp.]|uniref:hypothetical protein n=1 Tax=Winogradskyella sp. TaxID=1883156 RepID=UPI0017A32D7D|nr:hypothetical protein [Winogradskyella sp.]MBT8245834.1 hypothetical protein [Winogradskyella sp.]NNK22605.1 hypothetical protein [Winogradskyella sp.]